MKRRTFLTALAAIPVLGKFFEEPREAYAMSFDYVQAPTIHARDLPLTELPDITLRRNAIGPPILFLQRPKDGHARVGDLWIRGDHTLEATAVGWRPARRAPEV